MSLIALTLALSISSASTESGTDKIVLVPLSAFGAPEDLSRAVQGILEDELRDLIGARLARPDVEWRRRAAVCEGRRKCLNAMVQDQGWEYFIIGSVAGLGEDNVLHLKLVRSGDGEVQATISESMTGDAGELMRRTRYGAARLVAPDQLIGKLVISAPQPNIRVTVDGMIVGDSPLEAVELLLPVGRHAVEASGPGYVPYSAALELAYEESRPVRIDLPSSQVLVSGTVPYRHRWWTWGIATLGAASVGVGAYFNYLHRDASRAVVAQAKSGELNLYRADLYETERAHWNRAVGFYALGSALVTTTVGFLAADLFQ